MVVQHMPCLACLYDRETHYVGGLLVLSMKYNHVLAHLMLNL